MIVTSVNFFSDNLNISHEKFVHVSIEFCTHWNDGRAHTRNLINEFYCVQPQKCLNFRDQKYLSRSIFKLPDVCYN